MIVLPCTETNLYCIFLYYISRIKNYIGGIKGNLNIMPVYYSGWIMRLYVDFRQLNQFRHREIKDELCEIACTYPNFDICDASNLPGTPVEDASKIFAKNWRFFPTLDPQVKNSNEFRLGSVCKVVMGRSLKIRV